MPHIHLFKRVKLSDSHIHGYYECRCGARKVRRFGCCQPIAQCWLDGEAWPCDDLKVPPPKTYPLLRHREVMQP